MSKNQEQLDELIQRLDKLMQQQESFNKEIDQLKGELVQMKLRPNQSTESKAEKVATPLVNEQKETPRLTEKKEISPYPKWPTPGKTTSKKPWNPVSTKGTTKSSLEKFIGENLINKIGIVITVLGVAIGAKYSIDNNLISPLFRVILGYLSGFALLGVGLKLKKNYNTYSAVLVSGAMAILYFMTFIAFDFYQLIPQGLAFALMLLFTLFTVGAALLYNQQVIAVFGLVGAYALPFLIGSKESSDVTFFGYMTIINIGIMIVAVKKYWKTLYYSSFLVTWLIYFVWLINSYTANENTTIAFTFLGVFFAIFYITFIAYKLIQKEKFALWDIVFLLLNSFIFYGVGYMLLMDAGYDKYLGLFTIANALIHLGVTSLVYSQRLSDKNLLYMIAGLVLVFLTIAIPVQLDGNWVTLLWAAEAVLLFWIGRSNGVKAYEWISYGLIALSFFSLTHDWSSVSYYWQAEEGEHVMPILNIAFFSSLFVALAYFVINYFHFKTPYNVSNRKETFLANALKFVLPGLFLFVLYISFQNEIERFFMQIYHGSSQVLSEDEYGYKDTAMNYDLLKFKDVWSINFALLFLVVLSWINIKKVKNRIGGIANMALNVIASIAFLAGSLYMFSELRESYLGEGYDYGYTFPVSWKHIAIRYISFAFIGAMLYTGYKYIRQPFMDVNWLKPFDVMMHIAILWIISSELISWMDMGGTNESYKLGLSILWGVYSLVLIAFGIWRNKQYLRIAAIVLFGLTLLKLFIYDIADMNTLTKTIVFVSLGALLLIISFLYNKYKEKII